MKLFFLSQKCIIKVQKLVHKQLYYIASSAHIHALSCDAHFRKLQIIQRISDSSVKNQFLIIFDALANKIFPV